MANDKENPGEEIKRSQARGVRTLSMEQRQLVGQAIIDGLIDPTNFSFQNPLATEGGDYDQNGGGYEQSGGGNHDQGGDGGYKQTKKEAIDRRLINEPEELIKILERAQGPNPR